MNKYLFFLIKICRIKKHLLQGKNLNSLILTVLTEKHLWCVVALELSKRLRGIIRHSSGVVKVRGTTWLSDLSCV